MVRQAIEQRRCQGIQWDRGKRLGNICGYGPSDDQGVPGYPEWITPKPGHEKDVKARTLTNFDNQRLT